MQCLELLLSKYYTITYKADIKQINKEKIMTHHASVANLMYTAQTFHIWLLNSRQDGLLNHNPLGIGKIRPYLQQIPIQYTVC